MGRETQNEKEIQESLREKMLRDKLARMVGQPERDVWAEMRIRRKLDD
jgi:hypothetical protein